jgi:signal transduction histidine kinase
MELFYLLIGVGLGWGWSRTIRSDKKSEVSTTFVSEATDSLPINPSQEKSQVVASDIQLPQEEPQAVAPDIQPPQEESKLDDNNLQPLEEELKQTQLAYIMAQEMSQFKGGFLARTAHELRSPLSSLIGMHQLILSDLCDSPEEAREFVAQANTSALKMVKILDEVIAVSKTEHGTNRLETTTLPLSQTFEDVYRLTHMQAANSNLQFEIVSPEPEIYVVADARRFRQVLLGIVDAAIAQLGQRKEGSIKVFSSSSLESNQAQISIDVQSPNQNWSEAVDLLSTTPEPDKQAEQTSEFSPGLTLLMVQSLIKAMQGNLEVVAIPDSEASSMYEHCTRLQCSIPLATAETEEQALA